MEESGDRKKKVENLGFIEKFLQLTEGIKETNCIYQDIVDDVFQKEMSEATQDKDFIDSITLRRDMFT